MGLYIKCSRCNKNNTYMANFWSEYLCSECLKKEKKPLKLRIAEAFNERQELRKNGIKI